MQTEQPAGAASGAAGRARGGGEAYHSGRRGGAGEGGEQRRSELGDRKLTQMTQ